MKTYSHDLTQLSKLLSMVRSLIDNPSLFLEPYVSKGYHTSCLVHFRSILKNTLFSSNVVETKWKCITKEQPYLLKEPSNEMNNSMYKGNTSIKVKLKGGGGDSRHMWGIWLFRRIFGRTPHCGAPKFRQIWSSILHLVNGWKVFNRLPTLDSLMKRESISSTIHTIPTK